jgi:hypothetical protein
VYCSYGFYDPYLINSDSKNDNKLYIKSKDIINLRDTVDNFILRSHEFPFTIDNKTYQEVVGHEGRADGYDKVYCVIKIGRFFLYI